MILRHAKALRSLSPALGQISRFLLLCMCQLCNSIYIRIYNIDHYSTQRYTKSIRLCPLRRGNVALDVHLFFGVQAVGIACSIGYSVLVTTLFNFKHLFAERTD